MLVKVYDKIIFIKLCSHCQKLTIDEKHGSLPRKSTFSNLLLLDVLVLKSISNNSYLQALYTDEDKAFEEDNHDSLIYK